VDLYGGAVKRLAVALALALTVPSAGAQPAPDPPASTPAAPEDRCKAALEERKAIVTAPYCGALAIEVVTTLLESSRKHLETAIMAGAAQPRITDTPGAQSSAGQTAAVASGYPVATTGGSLAVVGDTGQGLQLVTALAVNPASLAVGDHPEKAIRANRFADVSIVLPLEIDAKADKSQQFHYIGGRVRINTLMAFDPPELGDADRAYKKLQGALQTLVPELTNLLQSADAPGKCARAIERADEAAQRQDCRGVLDTTSVSQSAPLARKALARFRDSADRKYLTLEGRFDRGDLNDDMAKDSLLAAYAAAGYTFRDAPDGGAIELRGRGGFVFFHDGATGQSTSAWYLSAGLELALVRNLKRYCLSVAFELTRQRDGNPMPAEASTDAVRVGVSVPLDDGKVVSVGVTLPTDGGPSTIALSGDWSLLFGR